MQRRVDQPEDHASQLEIKQERNVGERSAQEVFYLMQTIAKGIGVQVQLLGSLGSREIGRKVRFDRREQDALMISIIGKYGSQPRAGKINEFSGILDLKEEPG